MLQRLPPPTPTARLSLVDPDVVVARDRVLLLRAPGLHPRMGGGDLNAGIPVQVPQLVGVEALDLVDDLPSLLHVQSPSLLLQQVCRPRVVYTALIGDARRV